MTRPTRGTSAGRAYLDLQKLARGQGRPTDELQRLYALEGFLARLAGSPHVDRLILKGGVLLAAYDTRRPTRDIDFEGLRLPNDVEHLTSVVRDIAGRPGDDGLHFDVGSLRPETIREGDGDPYSGVRIHLTAGLLSARLAIGVDISVGDPIVPPPREVDIPRLLDPIPIRLKGYPLTMVLAEKIVTAVERGSANPRWRDFADVYVLAGRHDISGSEITAAITAVAGYRRAALRPLGEVLEGFAGLAQNRWRSWQRKRNPGLPQNLGDVLKRIVLFADPVLNGAAAEATWRADDLHWR